MAEGASFSSLSENVGLHSSAVTHHYVALSESDDSRKLLVKKSRPRTNDGSFWQRLVGRRFRNPWSTWVGFFWRIVPILRWKLCSRRPRRPTREEADETLPILDPDLSLHQPLDSDQLRVTWLGHASVLMQFREGTVLCDPIFSSHCGPSPCIGFRRFRPPPMRVDQLPVVDAVCISHDHYDHLDLKSVVALRDRFGDNLQWFVPIGLKSWFMKLHIRSDCIHDMTWWEEKTIETSIGSEMKFVMTPTQHWSSRTLFDSYASLWGSWAIIGGNVKAWFAGDTGYCEAFKEIGHFLGPFDFAAIPIGAYLPRDVMKNQHVDPGDAVKIHMDVRSRASLGIHWGTFTMGSIEHYLDPMHLLREECESSQVAENAFFVLNHGETKTLSRISERVT